MTINGLELPILANFVYPAFVRRVIKKVHVGKKAECSPVAVEE
jgi:hypothetical protein